MKKKLAAALASAMAVSMLAGCGGAPASESSTAPGSQSTLEKEPVEITFLSNSMYLSKASDEINESLQKQYPYLTVNIEHVADNYEAVLKTKLQTGGDLDLFSFTTGAAAKPFVEAGQVVDLSGTGLEEMLLESSAEAGKVDGKLYCTPISMQCSGLLYNKECFEKAGIEAAPRTLSELEDAVEKLNSVGIQPFASALKEQWVCYQWFWFAQSPFIDMPQWYADMNAGTGSFDQEGTREFFKVFDLIYQNCGENPLSSDYTNMCQLLGTGEAAMSILGDFAYPEAIKFNPEAQLGLSGVPVSENPEDAVVLTNASGVFVSAASEKQEAAIDFLRWVNSKEGTELISRLDGAGSTASCNPDLDLVGFAADGMKWIEDGNRSLPATWNYWGPGIMDAVGKDFQAYFAGDMTLDQMFEDLDSQWPQK